MYIKAIKPFDYLTAGEVYKVWPIDPNHTRFWNESKECGTFIANWAIDQAITNGLLERVENA